MEDETYNFTITKAGLQLAYGYSSTLPPGVVEEAWRTYRPEIAALIDAACRAVEKMTISITTSSRKEAAKAAAQSALAEINARLGKNYAVDVNSLAYTPGTQGHGGGAWILQTPSGAPQSPAVDTVPFEMINNAGNTSSVSVTVYVSVYASVS